MNHTYCCSQCNHGWQLLGDHEEVSAMVKLVNVEAKSFPCITPLCEGRIFQTSGVPLGTIVTELPVRSFYRAIHGFGTGEGDPASLKEFVDLLTNGNIVTVKATPIGQPERVILHQIVFEDGTRLHFDSSARGACCFYIEKSSKSCVEVVEDELHCDLDEALVQSSDSHREETGRDNARAEGLAESKSDSRPVFDATVECTRAEPVRAMPNDPDVPEHTSSGG